MCNKFLLQKCNSAGRCHVVSVNLQQTPAVDERATNIYCRYAGHCQVVSMSLQQTPAVGERATNICCRNVGHCQVESKAAMGKRPDGNTKELWASDDA
eukprot:1160865-Pelagomonas_calceolata.AAC.4